MPGHNTGINTIIFIGKDQVPKARAKDVTYGLITCLVRPEKKMNQTGQDWLRAGTGYPGDANTPTANLLTIKILINSIISSPGTKFMTMDIKELYLNTPMARYKYMQLHITDMPEDVIEHYNLRDKATLMAISTVKYKRGCMAYHRLVSLPSNFLRKVCRNMATVKARRPQAYGSTTLVP